MPFSIDLHTFMEVVVKDGVTIHSRSNLLNFDIVDHFDLVKG